MVTSNDTVVPAASISSPYYDDYAELKGFHRILFRPGKAVQARELTQLQTILQKQIQRFGKGIYTDGSMVTGGQITFQGMNEDINYLNLAATYANTTLAAIQWMWSTINSTSNATATVLTATDLTSTEPLTLIIRPVSGTQIKANDTISIVNETVFNVARSANVTSTGNASICSISTGIYFYNGYFIGVPEQIVILEKYSDTPSYRVGLQIEESIIDENSDTTLLDPAQEASNFQGPGAARYKIFARLSKRSLTSTDDTSFIELLRVENGIVKTQVSTPVYSDLATTMARRTFDESGNYTVSPFLLQLFDHIPEKIIGTGAITAGGTALTGTSTLFLNDLSVNSIVYANSQSNTVSAVASNVAATVGIFPNGAANSTILVQNPDKFSIKLSPGKAYVKGYEFETISPTVLSVKRGRATANLTNYTLTSTLGSYVHVTNLKGGADINNMELFDIHVVTSNNVNVTSNTAYATTLLGNCMIRAIEYNSASNTSNQQTHIYDAYLFNLNISNTTLSMNNSLGLVSHLSVVAGGFNRMMDIDVSSKSNTNINGNTVLVDPQFSSLIFPYPQSTVRPSSITGVNYKYRKLQSSVSFTSGSATLTLSAPDSFVGSGTLSDTDKLASYFVSVRDKGALPAGWSNGDIIPLTTVLGRSVTVSPITTAVINVGMANNFVADVIYSVPMVGSAPAARVKTRVYANIANVMSGGTGTTIATTNTTIFTANAFAQIQMYNANDVVKVIGTPQKLYVADIVALQKVYDFNGSNITQANLATAVDVTSRYILDNGQRDSYYDQGAISLKGGAAAPVGPLLVYVDFFTHSGTSGYLDMDSYPNATTNDGYKAIPSYTSPSTGKVYQLRDCIDWRPIRQNATETFTLLNARILEPKTSFLSSFAYYLSRVDKVVLTPDRVFKVLEGIPSLYPETPQEDSGSMLLYTLKVPAFTFNAVDVDVRFNENKRYTMRDIGRLEKRIDNLEYYTALNLLEKSADSLTVLDSAGLTRFKNGIVVDSFTGHKVGDVTSYDYYCSMDFEKGELHPPFIANNTTFNTNTLTNATNLGGMVTLSYTLADYVNQSIATDFENVNPFNYTSWIGTLTLIPDTDVWHDVVTRPQVLVNIEGENDAWETLGGTSAADTRPPGFGTRYNDWQSTWHGLSDSAAISTAQVTQDGTLNQLGITRSTTSTTDMTLTSVPTGITAPEAVTKTIGGSVVDVSVIPYIREKDVVVYSNNLRPACNFYPFFDGVNLLGYWMNPTLLRVDIPLVSGHFYTNLSSEVVTSNTSGSGVVLSAPVFSSQFSNTVFPFMAIVNDNGSFQQNNLVTGATSGAQASVLEVIKLTDNVASGTVNTSEIVLSTSVPSLNIWNVALLNSVITIPKGTGAGQIRSMTSYNVTTRTVGLNAPLTTSLDTTSMYSLGMPCTDPLGVLVGTLHIPNSAAKSFLAGTKKLRMTTSPQNAVEAIASYGEGSYYAQGLVEVRAPKVIPNVIAPEKVTTPVDSADTTVQVVARDPVPEVITPDIVPPAPPTPQIYVKFQRNLGLNQVFDGYFPPVPYSQLQAFAIAHPEVQGPGIINPNESSAQIATYVNDNQVTGRLGRLVYFHYNIG